jgi:hypothetical protein
MIWELRGQTSPTAGQHYVLFFHIVIIITISRLGSYLKWQNETHRPRSSTFSFVHPFPCLPTPIHTPFYLFLICSPYVLGHRDFFVLLYSLAQKEKRGDQQLATSFSFTLRWLLFKAKENITTRTLMVPRCEEETRRIYSISYVREHAIHIKHKERKQEKKRLSYIENKWSSLHFIDRKRENTKHSKLHSFIEKKGKTQKKKKNLSFFFAQNF